MDYEDLTPNEILIKLMNDNELESKTPIDILKGINNYYKPDQSALSKKNDELIDVMNNYNYLKQNNNELLDEIPSDYELNKILDSIVEGNELEEILFSEDFNNIYELEQINQNQLSVVDDFVLEKDVQKVLKNTDKKIGSVKQRTINIYDLYINDSDDKILYLLYEEDAEDLYKLLKNKLLIYWDCIINFDKVIVNETFLRHSFCKMMQYITPNDLISRIDLVNIDESLERLLYKELLPNAFLNYESSKTEIIDSTEFELLNDLDPNIKIYFNENGEKITDERIPFKKIYTKQLGNKREKKLKYPIYYVENVIRELIKDQNIDIHINEYISSIIDPHINWEEVRNNCEINVSFSMYEVSDYKLQFKPEVFDNIFSFVQALLIDRCYHFLEKLKNEIMNLREEIKIITNTLPTQFLNKYGRGFQTLYMNLELVESLPNDIRYKVKRLEDLEFTLMDKEHKYFIKEDILKNIFETIPFSAYQNKLDKVKLITYHYIIKHLDTISKDFYENLPKKMIRGFINISEIFKFELIEILLHDEVLKNFIFTMKEMSKKWVHEYARMSPGLSKIFYNINLTNEDIFSEYLLRYVSLSAIKRKNPMELRAIFSSYISLVHKALHYVFLHFNPSKKSYGCLGPINNIDDHTEFTSSKFFTIKNNDRKFAGVLLETYLEKNPNKVHDWYHLFKRIDFQNIFEYNSLQMISKKPTNCSIHDWVFYWNVCFKHFEKPIFKIKKNFIKSDKRNSQLLFITSMCHDILYNKFFESIKDHDYTKQVVDILSEDLAKKALNRGYLNKDFQLTLNSNSEYLNYIFEQLNKIEKIINSNKG